jgi:hypothetical protein
MDIRNLSVVRQSYANTVFTHKIQEIAAEFQENKVACIKIWNIVVVSIVLLLLIIQVTFPQVLIFSFIGSGITIAEVIFLIFQLTYNFEQKALLHKNSALKYMSLRDSYRLLITDIMNNSLEEIDIIKCRDSIQKQYQIICDLAPSTGQKEFSEAQKRLNKRGIISGEEFTWSDDEIDHFLPESLRFNNSN